MKKVVSFFQKILNRGVASSDEIQADVADLDNDDDDFDLVATLLACFIVFRVLQRCYYFMKGHTQLFQYSPAEELEKWFKKEDIIVSDHELKSPQDGVLLKYRRIGSGKRVVLLANGVGTALYMWLPIFKNLLSLKPSVFTGEGGITILAPCYRGLFGSVVTKDTKAREATIKRTPDTVTDPRYDDEVVITMKRCAQDLVDILEDAHANGLADAAYQKKGDDDEGGGMFKGSAWRDGGRDYIHFECVLGWSMGAQCILTCMEKHPFISKKLLLLNPSSGRSLHTVFQPLLALPYSITKYVGALMRHLIVDRVRPLIRTTVWDTLKAISDSMVMRVLLEWMSFWAGFPPEQGAYFHAYLFDVFSCRQQTRGLLDLIVALDSPLESEEGLSGGYGYSGEQRKAFGGKSEQTSVISGLTDFMTGIYHARILETNMNKRCTHKVYTMASHFLLLEWPELVSKDILDLLDKAYDRNFVRVRGNSALGIK
jgi:pimeloyl-ACP methyl ester carboxylesterase